MNTNLIAIDLAKNVFHLQGMSKTGRKTISKKVSRKRLVAEVLKLKPRTVVMEACYSVNYWGRLFQSHGIEVGAIPAQFVKPFVQGNKNDANDALAIAQASQRPKVRWVPIKTIEQQDIQSLHRIRQRHVENRTALGNQIRGLLSEYGIVIARSMSKLKLALPDILEDADNGLSPVAREFLQSLAEEFKAMTKMLERDERAITQLSGLNDDFQRLLTIPGVGKLMSSALIAAVGHASQFSSGRQLSAWMGLTPRQYASGEISHMSGISKRGNRYLRTLFIHGARAALSRCKRRDHHLLQWADKIAERRGKHKACVALANKIARVAWALLTHKTEFDYRTMCAA